MIDQFSKTLSEKEINILTPSAYAFIIQVPPIKDKTAGGIILPTTSQNEIESECQKGIIWKIGTRAFEGDYNKGEEPQVGNIAVVPKYSFGHGNIFLSETGIKYIILSEKNLVCFMPVKAQIVDGFIEFIE